MEIPNKILPGKSRQLPPSASGTLQGLPWKEAKEVHSRSGKAALEELITEVWALWPHPNSEHCPLCRNSAPSCYMTKVMQNPHACCWMSSMSRDWIPVSSIALS
jgi:hypothetical protein